jgi:hypothetical protein
MFHQCRSDHVSDASGPLPIATDLAGVARSDATEAAVGCCPCRGTGARLMRRREFIARLGNSCSAVFHSAEFASPVNSVASARQPVSMAMESGPPAGPHRRFAMSRAGY